MRKRRKKLALSRETLRHLQTSDLRHFHGGESGTCPTDCGSAAECGTQGCNSYGCTDSAGCPTYTCPPHSVLDSACPCG